MYENAVIFPIKIPICIKNMHFCRENNVFQINIDRFFLVYFAEEEIEGFLTYNK
jgi:hypothetical protein